MPMLVRECPSGCIRQRKQQPWMPVHWEDRARVNQGASGGSYLITDKVNERRMTIQWFDQCHPCIRLSDLSVFVKPPTTMAPDAFLLKMVQNDLAGIGQFLSYEEVFSLEQAMD